MSSRPPWVSSARHAERQPLGRRGRRVALGTSPACRRGTGARRRSRAAAPTRAAGRARRPGDDAGDARTRGALARREPRGEVAAGGVADRHDARHVEPKEGHGPSSGSPTRACAGRSARWSTAAATSSSVRGQPPPDGGRAAGTPRSTPPSRARRGRRRAGASACGRTAPSRSRRGARRPPGTGVAVGRNSSPNWRASPSRTGDAQAATPSERAASASRVMPSSICSGVTPE